MIDLRSDTVTRPTTGMREAMARAEVGDDALGDDPTTAALESAVAEILGKQAAVFFPSGIMANVTAVQLHAPAGTEVIVEAASHLFDWELAAHAALSGVQLRPVPTPDGLLTADLVAAAIRPPLPHQLRTSLVCIENTHNGAGGKVLPVQRQREIVAAAKERGLPVHLDGARLWNAAIAIGLSPRELAEGADTVMVTLSKGLGCPVGSLLAGTAETMERARWIRRRLGGSMRQSGILAAAGLYALEHHVERLADDHRRARTLAQAVKESKTLRVIEPDTNIVMFEIVDDAIDAPAIAKRLREHGVLMSVFTPKKLRAVTHLDIDDAAIQTAAAALLEVAP